MFLAPSAQASKNVVGYFGSEGPGIGQFTRFPEGVVVNDAGTGPGVSPGDVYVISGARPAKIHQFDAQGNLVRTVGWDIVHSGPDNTGANEQDTLTVPNTVTAGTFKLSVTTVLGEAQSHGSSNTLTDVFASTGDFQVGQPVFMESIPNGAIVTEVGEEGKLVLSQPATYGTNERRTILVKETTAPIAYNADAGTVQAALEGLIGIGAGGVEVSGGPGASGTPFTITFSSSQHGLAHNDIPPASVSNLLTGGAATITTTVEGGGAESCTVANPTDVCHNPVEPDHEWQPGNIYFPFGLEIDQATGNLFVGDGQRTEVFRSDGAYEGQIGRGMLTGASEVEFCTSVCKEPLGFDPTAIRLGRLTLDPTTGHLFGADSGRIDEFAISKNGSGEVAGIEFLQAFGWGVKTGAAEFETCTSPAECKPGIEGHGVGQIGSVENMAVNSAGVLYVSERLFEESIGLYNRVQSFTPSLGSYTPAIFAPSVFTGSVQGFEVDQKLTIGAGDHLFVTNATRPTPDPVCYNGLPPVVQEERLLELDPAGNLVDTHLTCAAFTFEWDDYLYNAVAANPTTGAIYIATGLFNSSNGQHPSSSEGRIFIVDNAESASSTIDSLTPNTSGATVVGTINPHGPVATYPNATSTTYQVEYKQSADSTWSKFASPVPVGAGFDDHQVTVHVGALEPNTSYDLRLVAQKPGQSNVYDERSFQTLKAPPTISGLSSSGVTKSTADLHARINPHGLETTYHFEYGTTPSYGQQTSDQSAGSGFGVVPVQSHVDNLNPVVYHFRVVAHNEVGTSVSGDQTFTFFPPQCPNGLVRQQNGSEYLPDCRSYELVSPPEAGNIILKPFFRPAPYATSPTRFLYGGIDGALAGTEATNSISVDTYVATRTSSGWHTTYPGIPGSQTNFAVFGMADMGLDKFLSFKTGGVAEIPYIYDVNDNFLGRWPANVASIPGGEEATGAFQPSPDFSHLAFSTKVDFDPEGHGLTSAPGSAYDYDVANETTTLISLTASGNDPIPQDPQNPYSKELILFGGMEFNEFAGNPIEVFPGVSTDGSHILMMTSTEPPCFSECRHTKVHLYMRVDDAITYEIADAKPVEYMGMTSDGSKLFFTSPLPLTSDDHDTSVDLFMWSEQGAKENKPLTLLSAGTGVGDTDDCHTGWTEKCSIGAVQGKLETDYPLATQSGDIYFYSPELLDGPENGIEGARNLYVYRNGHPRFVTRLNIDGSDPITRIQVSPQGDHAAFVTASRVTSYDNAGMKEMYTFNPSTDEVICVSCVPGGEAPTSDVEGSVSGFFMSNAGRAFFSTNDALVPRDTNEGSDVYEYTDGRPQLISAGTGPTQHNANGRIIPIDLMGVSPDGVDVYFSTFDTLVPQDRNGSFLKFYDARTGGGFLTNPASPPCEAADECHGAGSAPPPPPAIVSAGNLGAGGNAAAQPPRKKKKPRHAHRRKGHRHGKAGHKREGRQGR